MLLILDHMIHIIDHNDIPVKPNFPGLIFGKSFILN
jgi:hypothetical protein